jgi:hypothetical protein
MLEREDILPLQSAIFPLSEGPEPDCAGDVIGTNGFTDPRAHVPEHKPVKSFVLITSRRDRAFPSKTLQE